MTESNAQQNTLGFASVPAVRQYLRTAEEMDLDASAALKAAGVPPQQIEKENERITGYQFEKLIQNLIEQSGDPLLGLKSGQQVQPGSYSVLGYITMSCANLREAISKIIPYEKLVGDMGITTIEEHPLHVFLKWQCAYNDPQVRQHMTDNVLCSWLLYAQWLGNTQQHPVAVHLERPAPDLSVAQAYERMFQCPVKFAQPMSCLVISRSLMELPLRQPDAVLTKTLEDHAKIRMESLEDQENRLAIRVRAAIRHLLLQGITRKDMVAEQLQMNARTLQRKLAREDLSYQQLLDEVRHELAKHYLLQSSMSIQEISNRLGFTEPRSFHRRFKSWSGITPGEFRDQNTTR
ncbi:MAG: AraC family transcriptional regulator [Pseudomonadales bacterium]|nr:AraC family transcriptional regulator [Pseudomonadales bacterium]